jgi:hypothetical protein
MKLYPYIVELQIQLEITSKNRVPNHFLYEIERAKTLNESIAAAGRLYFQLLQKKK